MNVLATLAGPEIEPRRPSDGARADDRRAAGSAFEGAVREAAGEPGADRRARSHEEDADSVAGKRTTAPVPGKAPAERSAGLSAEDADRLSPDPQAGAAEEPSEKPSVGSNGEATRQGSDLVALLASALARHRSETGGEAGEEGGAGAGQLKSVATPTGGENDAEGKTDPADKARMRLSVLRMETHFEPAANAAILVEAETGAPSGPLSLKDILGAAMVRTGMARVPGERAERIAANTARAFAEILPTSEAASTDGATARAVEELLQTPLFDRRRGGEGGDARDTTPRAFARAIAASAREADMQMASVSGGSASGSLAPAVSQQVAARVIDAFRPMADAGFEPSRAPIEAELRMRAGGAALKTLTIQLQPEHLGTLDVSMRLVDGQLTLELAASQADTARLLTEDRAGLKSLLENAGFSLDDAAITVVTRDPGQATVNGSRNSAASGEGRPEGQRPDGGSGENGSSAGGGERREEPRGQPGGREAQGGSRRSGSTFL